MKNVIITLLFLFVGSNLHAQQFSKATLQATGLTCAMCSNAINKALLELPFVETVKSEITTSSFKIQFKASEAVSVDAIRKAVEEAGFSVGKLEITGNFEDVAIEKDKHVKIGNDVYHFLNAKLSKLNGEHTLTMADKGFLTPKEFRKLSNYSTMPCVQSGKAEECCKVEGVAAEARVYHITI